MRSRILALIFSLSFAGEASAGEIGPQLGFPLPGSQIGDHQLGIQAGLTANFFANPYVGLGPDLAYHYWPVSSEFKATFERQFYGLLRIGDPTWEISALQYTIHVKLLPPIRGAFRPWLQVGAGVYRVNPRLEFMGEKLKSVDELGGYTSLGLDYDANPSLRLGLDTSYHFLVLDQEYGSNFGAFEVGTHVLFGRP